MRILALLLAMAVTAFAATDSAPTIGIAQPQSDAWFDLVSTIEAEGAAGNAYCVGIGFDGENVWVTNGAGQAGEATGLFLVFDEDGTYITSFDQNNAPGWGLRDLAFDGTYVYGSVSTAIDYYDPSTYEKVEPSQAPRTPTEPLPTTAPTSTQATSVPKFTSSPGTA